MNKIISYLLYIGIFRYIWYMYYCHNGGRLKYSHYFFIFWAFKKFYFYRVKKNDLY